MSKITVPVWPGSFWRAFFLIEDSLLLKWPFSRCIHTWCRAERKIISLLYLLIKTWFHSWLFHPHYLLTSQSPVFKKSLLWGFRLPHNNFWDAHTFSIPVLLSFFEGQKFEFTWDLIHSFHKGEMLSVLNSDTVVV